MQKYKSKNKWHSWILVGIDIMTRQVFMAEAKTKKSEDMKIAFDKLFKKIPLKPANIFTDSGGEFESKTMREYFDKMEIQKFKSKDPDTKASISERVIKTIKGRLYSYFDANETFKWLDVIDKISTALNHSYHRTLDTTPSSINSKNWYSHFKRIYMAPQKTDRTYFSEGDWVRLAHLRSIFDRGFKSQFGDEIFKIAKINETNPITFQLENAKGGKVKGRFYKEHLSLSSFEDSLQVEKVLKSRKKNGETEFLVKFKNQSGNSWIKE